MPQEVTLYELKQLILKGHRRTEELSVEVAKLASEQAGNKVLAAVIDELVSAIDEQTIINRGIGQHYEGVRRLGETTYDMVSACTKRVRTLVQALVRCGVVTVEALAEDDADEEEAAKTEGGSVSPLRETKDR